MSPELYIPPCCIHKQLPGLIRSSAPFGFFYSQGDWGLKQLTHAVEHLVPSQDTEVTTILVLPDIDLPALYAIQHEIRMGWSRAFIIVTATDQTALIHDNADDDCISSITYCPSIKAAEDNNMWVRYSKQNALLVSGPITHHGAGPGRMSQYTFMYAENTTEPESISETIYTIKQAFAPWRQSIRLHATIRSSSPLIKYWLS